MEFKLKAKKREDIGKGASRRLRREQGVIPAVVYGGKTGPASITLNHNDLINMLEDDRVFASILSLEIDGKKEKVMLKDLQRHSFKNKLIHADFKRSKKKMDGMKTEKMDLDISTYHANVGL